MRRILIVLFVAALPLLADPSTLLAPSFAREGDVYPVLITRASGPLTAVLVSEVGSALAASPLLPLEGTRRTLYGFLAVPPGYGSSTASLMVRDGGGMVLISRRVTLLPRTYRKEEIPLTPGLTQIRTDQSERRIREARELSDLLFTVSPDAPGLSSLWFLPVSEGRFSSWFGDERLYRYANGGTDSSRHTGVDIAAPEGTPVHVPARAVVVLVRDRIVTGRTVVLRHGPGIYSLYYHLSSIAVEEGDEVEPGDLLGTVGSTGLATGAHLHWEVRVQGVPVDPLALVGGSLLDKLRELLIMEGRS
ncbi:M23 family metallopeptidase [Spirochaeta thermophila]|uniref:M23/M37 peptidase domain protein n=1 Tax=Winmispira thermophila (strain ATCC 49972 / DSM 6192 / RI 19.B1) TaxID=665571 RepID=E0RR35_WINT6|nr:M23 family metallopeptidase [Spirochaeta thermophila]ADN01613.1 M23/M37 peptidase domain protein [Spirochaeta thermophila DSM 6192]